MNPRQLQLKAVADLLKVSEASSSEQERNVGITACLHLLEELKQDEGDLAELNYLQGYAWYLSTNSEERDSKVLHFLSTALELDFEHIMAKVYLCHHFFDLGDYTEFLKHYQQIELYQDLSAWRKLKFLELRLIAKLETSSVTEAESDHFMTKYENAQENERPKIQELFDYSFSNEIKLPAKLKPFIFKWANYWGLKFKLD